MEKLCWFCEHFIYRQAEPDYSEFTPGEDFDIICIKNHWEFSPFHTSQDEFGAMLNAAKTCPDFVLRKELDRS